MTSSRPNQRSWVTAFENPPPAACETLRVLSNTVEFGLNCVFSEEEEEDGNGSLPNAVNTACLPWATGSAPATSIFYSPATACPTSWTAVATRTAAEGTNDWIDGETALECCPAGFTGGVGGMCNPGTSGTTPVVSCGEADAEENENLVYTAGSWPASVSARVTALQLRYQPTDIGLSATTRSTGTSTSTSSPGSESGSDGLSVGAKAAIGTVIPLVVILGTLAAFILWRRRKHRMAAAAFPSKHETDEDETKDGYVGAPQQSFANPKGSPVAVASGMAAATATTPRHETPEWNSELDATEAERRKYMAVQGSLFPAGRGTEATASSPGGLSEASELGGVMRAKRKPVAPVELDSTPVLPELNGDSNTERR